MNAECKWQKRGLGLFNTSKGSFRRKDSCNVFNQTVQIKSPVDVYYNSAFNHEPDVVPVPA